MRTPITYISLIFSVLIAGCCKKTSVVQNDFVSKKSIVVVKDFGAKGNGRSDDTRAIQRAIDYAAQFKNSTVYFPEGTYLVSRLNSKDYGCLEVPSNITIEGDQEHTSILKLKKNQAPLTRIILVRNKSNVVFRSMAFDGSAFYKENSIVKRNQKEFYQFKNRKKSNEQLHSIFIKSSTNVLIENCSFSNSKGDGVYITGVYSNNNQPSDIVIRDNVFYSSDRNGITLGHGFNDVTIDSNIFYGDNILTAMIDSEPIFETGESYVCSDLKIRQNEFLVHSSNKKRVDVAGSIVNRNVLIENNLFKNVELHLVNTENATVVNNEFYNENGRDIYSIRVRYYNHNLKILDNTFETSSEFPMIQIEGYSVNTKKADKSIEYPYPKNVEISNNNINLNANCIPISLQTVKEVSIRNNTVTQSAKCDYALIQLNPNAPKIGVESVEIIENKVSNMNYLLEVGNKGRGKVKCISILNNLFDGMKISKSLKECQKNQDQELRCNSNCYDKT